MNVPRKRYCVFNCDALVANCVPLHRFPHPEKHPDLFAAWVAAVGEKMQEIDSMKVYWNKRVCDYHFDPTNKASGRRLIWTAIPTLNLNPTYQVPFHQFPNPVKQPKLFAAWILSLGDKLTETDPLRIYRNKRVCDYHFDVSTQSSGGRLRHLAVPTMNLKGVQLTIKNIVESDHSYCSYRDIRVYNAFKSEERVHRGVSHAISALDSEELKPDDTGNDNVEDCQSDHDDAHSTQPPQTVGIKGEKIFSWQQTEYVIENAISNTDELQIVPGYQEPDETDVSLYHDEDTTKKTSGEPAEDCTYRCNNCGEKIIGFRYTCVQCVDWDLCGACEARAAHDTHYVLRVPGPRPYKEVQSMLETIRLQVLCSNVFIQDNEDSLKAEVKEEPGVAPECAVDPLCSSDVFQEDGTEDSADEDSITDCHRPRKRRRFQSDTDDSVTNDNTATLISDTEEYDTEHEKRDNIKITVPHESRRHDNQGRINSNILHKMSRGDDNSQQSEVTKGVISTDNEKKLKNTGLVEDYPKNTQIQTHDREIRMVTSQLMQEQFSKSEVPVLSANKVKSNRHLLLKVPPGMDPNTFILQLQLNRATVQLTPLNESGQQNNTKRLK